MKKILFSLCVVVSSFVLNAQVAINTSGNNPDGSAMLDISSTTHGILIPRMSASNRDNIPSPVQGLTVYVTDDNTFYYYDGSNWKSLQSGGKSWLLNGNTGTTGSEFLGTTDAQSLIFKTNGTERVQITDAGYIGVNTAPDSDNQLTVKADDKHVVGYFESTRTSSDDIAVKGVVASDDYWGIGGYFKGGYYGVQGVVMPTGSGTYYGVSSTVSGGSGTNFGVKSYTYGNGNNYSGYFSSLSSGGAGTVNYGITSIATGAEKNYGGFFQTSTASDKGSAGYFTNSNDNGTGIFTIGNNLSSYWYNSNGAALAASGKLFAIMGFSDNADDNTVCITGQYEGTSNNNATGVKGYSAPSASYGYGVVGYGGWVGAYGGTDSDGLAGVYGSAPTNGDDESAPYAVYANGDLGTSGAKNFIIDHPLDPENKILKHFSIESNEVLNVYRGNVTLDANGEAEIQLPRYFHAVNRHFSYMLTPVGSPAPGLYIAKEIDANGRFKIAGGQPGQKISWYVYAERNDPYFQHYPEKRRVEVEKPAKLRGKYFRPELYGQPASKGIDRVIKKIETKKMEVRNLAPQDDKH